MQIDVSIIKTFLEMDKNNQYCLHTGTGSSEGNLIRDEETMT